MGLVLFSKSLAFLSLEFLPSVVIFKEILSWLLIQDTFKNLEFVKIFEQCVSWKIFVVKLKFRIFMIPNFLRFLKWDPKHEFHFHWAYNTVGYEEKSRILIIPYRKQQTPQAID